MKKWSFSLLATLLWSVSVFAQNQTNSGVPWTITQTAWTDKHEQLFGEFVTRLGAAVENRQCATFTDCLKSSANMYYGTDPVGLRYYSDCADLPYYLRAYFAFKNGLPFSFANGVAPRQGQDVKDIRYTPLGNIVTKRYDVLTKVDSYGYPTYRDAVRVLNNIGDQISSANMRMPGDGEQDAVLYSDFYPAKLSRDGIRPGTLIYDPNGHVAVVYKVTDSGRIFYIDAHPDNSLTMGMYTPKFVRSLPGQGAGFKNFRPLKLVGAQKIGTQYLGGQIVAAKNSELPGYGMEQFYGTNPDPSGEWSKGTFVFQDQVVDYYTYVRYILTIGELHADPIQDMKDTVADICISLHDRVPAVDSARTSSVQLKPHPDRLPLNIYGADGEWESYATPSRDARLKVAFVDLLNQTRAAVEKNQLRDTSVKYAGNSLARDLFETYKQAAVACQFSYYNSAGQAVPLNLEYARQRVFSMSFDPYNCVELRWGATSAAELATCMDDATKQRWYSQERWLRNQTERSYDARMDYSLDELTGPFPGVGVETAPDVDIVGYLTSHIVFSSAKALSLEKP